MLGVAPAVRLARTDLKTLMNESGRSRRAAAAATARLMGVMTVAEVALALMLVAGAGWLVQSFAQAAEHRSGFRRRRDGCWSTSSEPAERARRRKQTVAWTRSLFERLRGLPGVTAVGSTAAFPLARHARQFRVRRSFRARRSIPRTREARACGS